MAPEPQGIDTEPPATAAEWLEVRPDDRHPYGFEPREQALDAAEVEWDSAESNAYQARVEAGLEPEAEPVTDPWKPYIDAARATGEAEAWVPDYGAGDSLWMRVDVPAAATPQPELEAEL